MPRAIFEPDTYCTRTPDASDVVEHLQTTKGHRPMPGRYIIAERMEKPAGVQNRKHAIPAKPFAMAPIGPDGFRRLTMPVYNEIMKEARAMGYPGQVNIIASSNGGPNGSKSYHFVCLENARGYTPPPLPPPAEELASLQPKAAGLDVPGDEREI